MDTYGFMNIGIVLQKCQFSKQNYFKKQIILLNVTSFQLVQKLNNHIFISDFLKEQISNLTISTNLAMANWSPKTYRSKIVGD